MSRRADLIEHRDQAHHDNATAGTRGHSSLLEEAQHLDIYVGNLRYTVTADELCELFADHGSVVSCELVTDGGGRPRGYGYVVMSDEEGTAAIAAIDGTGFHGRPLRVNRARSRVS